MPDNINYALSNTVEVFPAGFRSQMYVKSRLTTEENLVRLRQFSSYKELNNYFITYKTNNEQILYIIGISGYEFIFSWEENNSSSIPAGKYAFIKLKTIDSPEDGLQIKVLDRLDTENDALILDVTSN